VSRRRHALISITVSVRDGRCRNAVGGTGRGCPAGLARDNREYRLHPAAALDLDAFDCAPSEVRRSGTRPKSGRLVPITSDGDQHCRTRAASVSVPQCAPLRVGHLAGDDEDSVDQRPNTAASEGH
jgi:hypothetical protein